MSEQANSSGSNSDAEFLGWQETLSGDFVPLFNIILTEHPLFGSTETRKGLSRLNLQIPRTPLHHGSAKKY